MLQKLKIALLIVILAEEIRSARKLKVKYKKLRLTDYGISKIS